MTVKSEIFCSSSTKNVSQLKSNCVDVQLDDTIKTLLERIQTENSIKEKKKMEISNQIQAIMISRNKELEVLKEKQEMFRNMVVESDQTLDVISQDLEERQKLRKMLSNDIQYEEFLNYI